MMDKAHKQTDKMLATMERNIRRIFGKCGKEVKKVSDEYLAAFQLKDEKKRLLVSAGKMSEADYKKWRAMQITTSSRYRHLSEKLTAEMLHSYEAAVAYANGKLPMIYTLNYNAVNKRLGSMIKGYSFELVDTQTVANLAARKSTLLPYKTVNKKKFERWSRQKTNSAVLSSIMKGDSIPKIAEALIRVVGMPEATAITNARTMVTSAENKGRVDSMKRAEAMGTRLKKQWIATLDNRTRDWHADLDGETIPLDEAFYNEKGEIQFPGDPDATPANVYNCRCTIAEIVEGFNPVPKEISFEEFAENGE